MRRWVLVGVVPAVLASGLWARPAAAHVTARATDVADSGVATVTFSFEHGCDGQPTTSLRVALPQDGVAEAVAQPADGFETTTTERELSWTGGSVPDGQRATFTATMRVWGDEGTTIWLKTVQDCPNGQEAWIEEQPPGAPEPAYVAPRIVLPRTIAPPETTSTTAPTTRAAPAPTTSSTAVAAAISDEGSPSSTTGLVVFVGVCAVLAGGALVLFLRHRRTGTPSG